MQLWRERLLLAVWKGRNDSNRTLSGMSWNRTVKEVLRNTKRTIIQPEHTGTTKTEQILPTSGENEYPQPKINDPKKVNSVYNSATSCLNLNLGLFYFMFVAWRSFSKLEYVNNHNNHKCEEIRIDGKFSSGGFWKLVKKMKKKKED